MYSTYDSANKLAELQNNCSILGVNIQNLCDYVIIDKIQDGVRFGRKNLNMWYPHTRIIIPVYSHHFSWLLSLFHASIQLVILGNPFFCTNGSNFMWLHNHRYNSLSKWRHLQWYCVQTKRKALVRVWYMPHQL